MTTMKSIRHMLAIFTLVAATAFMSQGLHAQTSYGSRVNIPFAFNCGTAHFAPGTYTVKVISTGVMSISGYAKSGYASFTEDRESRGPSNGYLVFRKYGNQYFLEQYHAALSPAMATLPESDAERNTAREFAANQENQRPTRLALLENGKILSPQR
jgi:hypothetical protein